MRKIFIPTLAFALFALAACNQATTPGSSGSPGASGSAVPRATGSVAASASAGASAKEITLQVTVPEENSKAGVNGTGWTVDVIAKGNGPNMDKVKPAFRATTSSGKNTAFPGLVVLIRPVGSSAQTSTASPSAASQPNLAGLFQIIGLPNMLGSTASISSVNTATGSPAASATGGAGATGASGAASASARPSGTAATRSTTTTDNDTAEATWFVQQSLWGTDVDVEMTVFVVDGDAPDAVTDRSSLKIISNEITVRFHINGNGTASPTGSAAPSGSASPAGSPSTSPSGTARPSASPTSTP
ncbi:MAG TPA: hypothetical protein VFV20_03130 [Candidatus Limnocylindria bacterium]|nr:hypothetical protein [Candidatus Limnocylindria bacterium]